MLLRRCFGLTIQKKTVPSLERMLYYDGRTCLSKARKAFLPKEQELKEHDSGWVKTGTALVVLSQGIIWQILMT